ncbi:hypothetical protein [Cryobacterium fucosi]|uniref:DUF2188 domain-containing protein n=1 Tax=Cryobacterium fucosi TaxID=1259157 RepID=A0A4R9AUS4_9MICO|nr:hypothetical protein [Cryobacterium fucosi]TFD70550.1 hypothetical protein E3T48_16490 [Cryobacterium fucosi]
MWFVYSVPECEELSGHSTRDEAVGAAVAEATRGGWLTVHYSDGAVESQQEYPAVTESSDAATPSGADPPRTLEAAASSFASSPGTCPAAC